MTGAAKEKTTDLYWTRRISRCHNVLAVTGEYLLGISLKRLGQRFLQLSIIGLFLYVAMLEMSGSGLGSGAALTEASGSVLDRAQAQQMFTQLGGSPDKLPVVMFATSWCGVCRALESELSRQGVEFLRVDIERDRNAAYYYERLTRGRSSGVPLTAVGEKVFLGFQLKSILRAVSDLQTQGLNSPQVT